MKINYLGFIGSFFIFFSLKWGFDFFKMESLVSSLLWSFFTALLFGLFIKNQPSPIKGLDLKLQEHEEIIATFFVTLRQTKFNWIKGNLFVTNQRFSFVDRKKNATQIDDDLHFNEIKEVILLPQKLIKSETIKLTTYKNEIFYVNAFNRNKELFDLFENKREKKG